MRFEGEFRGGRIWGHGKQSSWYILCTQYSSS
jgi:hypothetical protein